ncbi:ABC transporter permease subunit [Bdellovibrionota bacterium FG-1]
MQRTVFAKKYFSIPDLIICFLVGTAIYGLVSIGREWRAEYNPVTNISLSVGSLLYYTLLSGIRGTVAYLISLAFTLVVGFIAAKNRQAERFIIPMLDILQSIPVLGFLPGLLLALIALFPHSNTGIELAAILMIFTGQVWNMTFSYYASLKSVPTDLTEAATVIGLSWWQRLVKVELPYSAVNLAWNSLMSMAGGWFFLNVCEASKFGDREYRLPGVGAYMAVAISQDNRRAMVLGVLAMMGLIISMDFFFWRPVLSWVQRFRLEEVQGGLGDPPLMSIMLRESKIIRWLEIEWRRWRGARRALAARVGLLDSSAKAKISLETSTIASIDVFDPELGPLDSARMRLLLKKIARTRHDPWLMRGLERLLGLLVLCALLYGAWSLLKVLLTVSVATWVVLIRNTFWTLMRVMIALGLSTLWAVPVGIWLGINARRMRLAQPLIQVLASFPAPMLYPLALGIFFLLGINFDWGSMFLMMLGVQWYILFNVLAGAMRVPRELKYALELMETPRWLQWRMLYLPSVFPALVTGWVTAAGGAWNASMVAEIVPFRGHALRTSGLGASISTATASGDFRTLAASLTLMVFVVIFFNRVLWAPVYRLAQTRFRMDLS